MIVKIKLRTGNKANMEVHPGFETKVRRHQGYPESETDIIHSLTLKRIYGEGFQVCGVDPPC